MFDNSITLTRNAVAIVMARVNQDKYSSEYLFSDATQECKLFIRHTTEKPLPNGVVVERHNITFERKVFGIAPAVDVLESFSGTFRYQKKADKASNALTQKALTDFLIAANSARILSWES